MQDIWPHVPLRALRLAQVRIAHVTRKIIGEMSVAEFPSPDDDAELLATGVAAFQSGMGPLLAYWVEHGQLRADDVVAALLQEHLRHGRIRAAMIERHLVRLLARFRAANVVPVILKGTFTARRYFPEPGTRSVCDIDLLVPPARFEVSEQVLQSARFVEEKALRVAGRSSTWRMAGMAPEVRSVELDHAENPWSVDLHQALDRPYCRGLWSRYDATPWENLEAWETSGESSFVLSQPLRTVHLAEHASHPINVTRLIRVVELVTVLRTDLAAGRLDWQSLAAMLTTTGLWRFVYPAFEMAERLAPGVLDPQFRQAVAAAATPRCRRVVERVVTNGFQGWSDRHPDEKLMWVRGPRETVLNFLDLVFPRGIPVKEVFSLQAERARMLFRRSA